MFTITENTRVKAIALLNIAIDVYLNQHAANCSNWDYLGEMIEAWCDLNKHLGQTCVAQSFAAQFGVQLERGDAVVSYPHQARLC